MTWEELKEEAKWMGYEIVIRNVGGFTYEKIIVGRYKNIFFYRDGTMSCPFNYIDENGYAKEERIVMASFLTPDQMLAIMKALQQKEEE